MAAIRQERRAIGELKPAEYNPRKRLQPGDEEYERLKRSIETFGYVDPIIINADGTVIGGHQRLFVLQDLGYAEADVAVVDLSKADEKALNVALNKISGEWDDEKLAALFADLNADEYDLSMTGYGQDEISEIMSKLDFGCEDPGHAEEAPSLSDRFIFPPTTVLNARDGEWSKRKDEWKGIGISSEVGRDKNLAYDNAAVADPTFYDKKTKLEKELGRKLTAKEFEEKYYVPPETDNGTSIFDPVLCELCIKWFSGDGAKVLDPFAGGSVRGIVSVLSGREYTGIDLRPEQIEANEAQWEKIKGNYQDAPAPHWITGDSLKVIQTLDGKYDMIMSCPPYADLEVYSDDPADLSNMDYEDFLVAYREIIRLAVERLEDNRFAVFVVGEVRGKDGNYISFVPDTIRAFEDAGAHFYNEAILVTPISGLRFRIGRMFSKNRKMGKTHQNILVFVKGDPNKATEFCGDVSADMPDEYLEDEENS